MALQQIGSYGYKKMIAEDIELSKLLFELTASHPELEAVTQNLSIATFRYVPQKQLPKNNTQKETYLNTLNEALLNKLQQGGYLFLSNALIQEKYCLRGCIVNFRTSIKDIYEIIEHIVKEGRSIHTKLNLNNDGSH